MPLNATFVDKVKPGPAAAGDKHADGGGLYLLVKQSIKSVSKYWRLDYRFDGKRKTLALGVYPTVSLAKARKRREDARELLDEGIDPAEAKASEKLSKARDANSTFEMVARTWLAKTSTTRVASTQEKNTTWLERNIFPEIGPMPIAAIGPRDVLAALAKIEARGAIESAHKIKQLCGQVFRFAVATGQAERDVTADLRGALAAIPRTHYAAITEPSAAGALMRAIHAYAGHPFAVAALKLSPLVFVRPGELRSAEWCEIDLAAAEWRIPGVKMKMKADHLVPLSRQAVAVFREMDAVTGGGKYVFPSIRTADRCMSENTVNAAIRNLGYTKEQMTAHGFRAMARTIMDEVLGERVDLIEHQLAHQVKDVNGRAYNRMAHLPARREMMQRWADYLDELMLNNE
ncbi:tyrosine-type recombinase/integrase [Massilia sp. PWRC2]|uniref:tyrosine-type recombinase/integrase n=1 Tax=Massilia sp. PWRC2 TaxID=2804626 RepID=UPI003CEDA3BC